MPARAADSSHPDQLAKSPSAAVAEYSVAEAARPLDLTPSIVHKLVREGMIPAERLGRHWVIPRTRFDTWLAEIREEAGMNRSQVRRSARSDG